jgi:acetoacetyl-CoA reductase
MVTFKLVPPQGDNMSKIAYVTGGMGGIGTAICRKFHDMGYKVIAGCGPTRDFKKWLAQQQESGCQFQASVGNVADWESTKAAFDKAKAEHGTIDILVNNAGITRDGLFRKMPLEDWLAVINTNLNSLFNVTKQVIDGMLDKGWGRVSTSPPLMERRANSGRPTTRRPKLECMALRWHWRRRLRTKA